MKYLKKEIISPLFLIFIIFFGCSQKKNNAHNIKNSTEKVFSRNIQLINENENLVYKLPDTIALKDTLKGYIIYKSKFDLLKLPNKEHYVDFYFAKTKSISSSYEEFKTKKIDTFARIHDSLLLIYGITFKKRGDYLLEGYIKDHLFYDEGIDSAHYKTSTRHLEYRLHVK